MPPAAVYAASISAQPADQSVPMGLPATFGVTASGSSLQYQWAKNGAAIAGATASTYTTPPTAFADTGSSFSVSVSNSDGTVKSNTASLTVTGRAPAAGDLRFQQVDSPASVNGWGDDGAGLTTNLIGRTAQDFYPSIGTSFYVGSAGSCAVPPVTDGTGCSWEFTEFPVAASASTPELLTGYASDDFDNFDADLQSGSWPALGNGALPSSPSSVVTSLDLEPASVLFALSWIQSAQQTVFQRVQNTVTLANLAAAANQEGASSRVITAVSNNAGRITYFAYGWQADTTTLYEAQVLTASPSGAPAAAASLASQGFIITATGAADSNGNVILVGTRVQGDTVARPFVAAQGAAVRDMLQQGYATVGVIFDLSNASDPYTYLGER